MLDGKCHRRRAELGEHRAVGEFDDRVDDALRVHDGGALLGTEAEEALGLDQLEAFVGQRGGVDGYFGAHRPIGMFDGVGGGDGGEAVDGPVAERAAARGDRDAADGRVGVALEALENGAVFAVDREKFRAALRGGGEHVLAGENEDLFGSEGEVFASVKRGEGGFEAGGAHDGDEDDIGRGQLGEFDEAGEAADEARAGRKSGGLGASGGEGFFIEEADVADAMGGCDGREFFPIAPGGDRDELEFIWVGCDDAQRALADGTGGAEEDDAFAGGGGDVHALRQAKEKITDRRGQQQTVAQVKHAADAGDAAAGVLHVGAAFDHGFDEVGDDADGRDRCGNQRGDQRRHVTGEVVA